MTAQPNTPTATPERKSIKSLLTGEEFRAQLAMALPRHLGPDRMMRVVLTSIRKTPKLLQCTPESFFSAVLTCAQLGLEPDDPRGQAHLVPFNKKNRDTNQWVTECQVIIGYRGYIDLARRTGEIANIRAEVVYEKDRFEYETGLVTRLVHVPTEDAEPGMVRAAYAIATMKDGTQLEKVLFRRDIERARVSSKEGQKDRGPWVDWYPEMAQKTAIRRLMKTLPSSPEISLANVVDESSRPMPLKMDGKALVVDMEAAVAALDEPEDATTQTAPVADRMAANAARAAQAQAEFVDNSPEIDETGDVKF